MPAECKNAFVGIAMAIGTVIAAMVVLTLLFAPAQFVVVERIVGYLVILGIVLGFFQYFSLKDNSEKAPDQKKRK